MGLGRRHRNRGQARLSSHGGACTHELESRETTLDCLHGGDEVEIMDVADAGARMHALRFGMAEGAHARCVTRIPAGPIVMCSGRQEIAIGRRLARRIHVRRISGGGDHDSLEAG